MAARIMIALLAMMLGLGTTGTAVLAGETVENAVLQEDDTDVAIVEDDDDGTATRATPVVAARSTAARATATTARTAR